MLYSGASGCKGVTRFATGLDANHSRSETRLREACERFVWARVVLAPDWDMAYIRYINSHSFRQMEIQDQS